MAHGPQLAHLRRRLANRMVAGAEQLGRLPEGEFPAEAEQEDVPLARRETLEERERGGPLGRSDGHLVEGVSAIL